jgi:hypothetical protein
MVDLQSYAEQGLPASHTLSKSKLDELLPAIKSDGGKGSSSLRTHSSEKPGNVNNPPKPAVLEAIITNGAPLSSKPDVPTYTSPSNTAPTK